MRKGRPAKSGRLESLEPRILYSADFSPATVDDQSLDTSVEQRSLDAGGEFLSAACSSSTVARYEIVFVDSAVSDADQLLRELRAASGADRQLELVFLDAQRDGIEQISETLSSRSDISAVHVISHGSDGTVQLGSSTLDFEALLASASKIKGWGESLTDDADILIYGCNVAENESGRNLLKALARLTGADVAGSDDLTGSQAAGGDWDLEFTVGDVSSSGVLGYGVQFDWRGVLATYTVSSTNNSGAGSLRQAIIDANANAGADIITFSIAGTGVHTINVLSALPTITGTVTIDATTDDSFAANSNRPAIILDGNNAFTGDGLVLSATADGSTIRGFVIRDFSGDGIEIQAGSNNNTIAGNYIGRLTATGTDAGAAEANTGSGINLLGSNNTIGGLAAADRNIISGNGAEGIYLEFTSGNTIIGNYIGTDATGMLDLGNTGRGILMESGSNNNTIGGTTAAARNVIAGNDTSGILIVDSVSPGTNSTGNVVQGNYIGVGADGTTALGNLQHGVRIDTGAGNNQIGGTAAGAGNLIAFNASTGVKITNGSGVAILGNHIYSNTDLGVDLGTSGVTANDPGDGDTGANGLQNFPVLTGANSNSAGTTIVGTLNSTANTTFRIEFFGNRPGVVDASNGEGERYLGYITVTTDGSGNASYNTTLANVWVNSGDRITATATVDLGGGSYGSTSEFAANVTASSTGIIVVDTTSDTSDGTTTSITNLGNNRGADGRISLREAIAAANNTANGGSPDRIVFNIPGSGTHIINVASALPTLNQALFIDGLSEPDYAGAPVVRIDGAAAGFSGITIGAGGGGSTIQGLMITGFTVDGINVAAGANNVTIADNWIGTAGTGTTGIGNSGVGNTDDGIDIAGSNASILRNVITNSGDEGITIVGSGVTAHIIQGNYIGVDPDGATGGGNTDVGIAIISGSGNTIGGTAVGAGNVISKNLEGIEINTSNNIVQGNYIGTDATGVLNLGNRSGDGVQVQGSSTGNLIGGTAEGAGNVIAFNAGDGVAVVNGTDNAIVRNSIFANTGQAIDLGPAGVTANDSGDGDTGANSLQNFPVLSSTVTSGGQITIAGTLNSTASTSYRIEFYANATGDGSGYGEGQTLIGVTDVTTDAFGNASYTPTFTAAVAPGSAISATVSRLDAGDMEVETSEFALNVIATAGNAAPTITNVSGDSLSYNEGDGAVVIEQGGNALVADVDSANFDTGTLTVSIPVGGDSAEDVLSIRNQGTSAGEIGVSGANVTYQGVTIGTFTGGSSGSNLVITLNSSATPTAVTALVKNITYENTDTNAPTTGARTVRYVLTDGDGGTSANYDATVTVTAANDVPTFSVGDGQALTSFGAGWEFGREVIIQPDGKILVGGYSDSGGSDDFSLVRYSADGTLDTSFGGGDGVAFAGIVGRAEAMVLQADGKVVLSGYTTPGGNQVCLVRFNADGSLDASFGGGDGIASSGVYGSAKDVVVQSDGKFLVAADLSNSNFNLMRFNSDGSLDTSFGGGSGYVSTDLAGSNDRADSLTLQSDGKVLLSGFGFNGTSFDFALVRYNTDGSLDTSFNGTGKVLTDFGANSSDMGNEVRMQADGKIVVAGWSNVGGTNDFAIARYNANGTLDTGFGSGGKVTINLGASDLAEGLTIQSDGKILVTGTAGINGGDVGLVRLNTDGSLDTTFGGGDGIVTTNYSGSSDDRAYSVAVQSDGRIVVSGTTQVGVGGYNVALNRYSSTGSLDTTLDPVNTLNGTPMFTEGGAAVVLDADVQIFDAELSSLNNFNGATLTLVRNGGANAEDVFSATGTLSLSSGNVIVSGTTIGMYTNSGGTLTFTFNSNATQTLVNSAMQQIAYSNSSDAPPSSVQINWTFNDGNTGAQGGGGALSAIGSTTVSITAVNDAPTGTPIVTGTPTEDQTLTANTGSIADADGLGSFSYQWQRNGVNIAGATGSTYTLGDADVGTNIRVVVSYTDGQGSAESLTSAAVGPIANLNDAPTGSVTIDDTTPTQGQTLTANNTLADADGLGAITYQWQRGGVDIAGATGSTYTALQADVGQTLTVVASYVDGQGTAESIASAPTAVVTNVNDAPTGAPTITGTATEDQTLSADVSGIADADGLGAFSYQWQRGGLNIVGATGATYTLSDADVGTNIRVVVSYTDGQGTVESLTSAVLGPVANTNDAPTGVPTITGTATEDQTLSADTSGIADDDGLGVFAYQWLREGVAIAGATGSSYTLSEEDVGSQIAVQVSFTDAYGSTEVLESAAVGPVASSPTMLTPLVSDPLFALAPPDAVLVPGDVAGGDSRSTSPVAQAEIPEETGSQEQAQSSADEATGGGVGEANSWVRLDATSRSGHIARLLARLSHAATFNESPLHVREAVADGHDDFMLLLSKDIGDSVRFRPSTPDDWQAATVFDEGEEDSSQKELQVLIDSVKFGGMALSVGAVWWASRLGGLVGSMLASAPAWRHMDPLPVLGRSEDEDDASWCEPADKDADANELAISLVLDGGAGHQSAADRRR